jgi:hypothetical protein
MLLDEIRLGSTLDDIISLGLPYNSSPANGEMHANPNLSQFSFDLPSMVYTTDPNMFSDPNFPAGNYDLYVGVATEPNYAAPHYGLSFFKSGTAVYGGENIVTRSGTLAAASYLWCVVLKGDKDPSAEILGLPWSFRVSTNQVPTVAPVDIYAVGDPNAIVTLNGYASDFDNAPQALTYLWSQVSGTPTVINDTNKTLATPTVHLPIGDYEFSLTVSDSVDTATGNVKVAVRATACEAAKANPAYYTSIKKAGDVNDDCEVDIDDLKQVSFDWLKCSSLLCP